MSRFPMLGLLLRPLTLAASALLAMPAGLALADGYPVSPLVPVARSLGMDSAADLEGIAASAVPMEQLLSRQEMVAPSSFRRSAVAVPDGPPEIIGGRLGMAARFGVDEGAWRRTEDAMAQAAPDVTLPQNYGLGQAASVYHFNDYREFPRPVFFPQRAIGRLLFRPAGAGADEWYACTATLISNTLLLTAGHCVYEGGTGNDTGWNQEGIFVPSYSGSDGGLNGRFGFCRVNRWATTPGWYSGGQLDQAYDIGLALCGRLEGARVTRLNGRAPGWALGSLPFCVENCRQPYWMLSQFGYPANYYSGTEMTVSQHIEVAGQANPVTLTTGGRDYLYGTGMRGGSSGGPHVSNIGSLASTSSAGSFESRNVIFAVTSWGYVDDIWKIQGATPLSGFENGVDFRTMFNQMCAISRQTLGWGTCRNI